MCSAASVFYNVFNIEVRFNLNIDFIYQKHIDLVFHILAHIKVNNPSDLYSEPYIEKMSLAIQDDKIFLPQSVVKYYNQNFNRLGIINFLPFFTQNMEEFIQLLRDYNGFNENDNTLFVYSFVDTLIKHSSKYFEFWDKQFDKEKANRLLIEEILRNRINQYSFIFDYYKKSAKVWLSFSMTKNGRGIGGISNSFSAAVPFSGKIAFGNRVFMPVVKNFYGPVIREIFRSYVFAAGLLFIDILCIFVPVFVQRIAPLGVKAEHIEF